MMELTLKGISSKEEWLKAGVRIPSFDILKMRENTNAAPEWIHFGAGNIFRCFIAAIAQRLLEKDLSQTGIIAVDSHNFEIIDQIYKPFDNLALSVGLQPDGDMTKEIIASVADVVKADFSNDENREKLVFAACNPSLKMISFTITEKGYSLRNMEGMLQSGVIADMEKGPKNPKHTMSIITMLMWERFKSGGAPIALCSMDNCSHNGEILKNSVLEIANAWYEKGFVGLDFCEYLQDETKVAFPWSMIDKITPRPSAEIEKKLLSLGIEKMSPVICGNTYIAPFVNAEIPEYLVIEDRFPNGRPALEEAGVFMTDRETVNKTERMKVTTCLNPLHTAMAVFGCLLGYVHIATEFKDSDIHTLVENIGYSEGLPVVTDPGIIHPSDFLAEVMNDRLPNMFLPDMPQRIATDTSMKIPIRFGETIKAYVENPERDVKNLTYIPLAIAAWFRYLLGIDDEGKKMEVSSDPLLNDLQDILKGIRYDDVSSYNGELKKILSNKSIFASDLVEIGLGSKIEEMFKEMLNGNGSVRKTLHKYCSLSL